MLWSFHILIIAVLSGQTVKLNILVRSKFCKISLLVYFYLLILKPPLMIWRWQKQLLLIVFKCLKHDAPSYLSSKFVYTSSVHSQNTSSQTSNTLLMPSFNIKPGKRTFNFRGSSIWNSLPTDVRCNLFSMSIQTFKAHVIFQIMWNCCIVFNQYITLLYFIIKCVLISFCILYILITIINCIFLLFHIYYNSYQGLMGDQFL